MLLLLFLFPNTWCLAYRLCDLIWHNSAKGLVSKETFAPETEDPVPLCFQGLFSGEGKVIKTNSTEYSMEQALIKYD